MVDRNLAGYGRNPPNSRWSDEARIAEQFVLNIVEGAESSIVNGEYQVAPPSQVVDRFLGLVNGKSLGVSMAFSNTREARPIGG